jgi:hypothetical protein
MGQISMEIMCLPGSLLSGNQQPGALVPSSQFPLITPTRKLEEGVGNPLRSAVTFVHLLCAY